METQTETPKERFADSFDFDKIYTIKGKQGLHYQVSNTQKSGVVGMREFLSDSKPVTVLTNTVTPLRYYVITLQDQTKYPIYEAFNNLATKTNEELKELSPIELMELAAPNYDPEYFKPYHIVKLMKWYLELKQKKSFMQDIIKTQ